MAEGFLFEICWKYENLENIPIFTVLGFEINSLSCISNGKKEKFVFWIKTDSNAQKQNSLIMIWYTTW